MSGDLFFVKPVAWIDRFDLGPELLRVIHVPRMAKLVHKHVVDEFVRKLHEGDIEADRAGAATASPSAACMAKAYAFIRKAVLLSELGEAVW